MAVFMNCYDRIMRKKSLIETNPYLRDPEQRRKGLIRSIATSTAIETGAKCRNHRADFEEGAEDPAR